MAIPLRTAIILAAVTFSAPAFAHDSELDDAYAHINKAQHLLHAAESASTARGYSQHLSRAEQMLDQAMRQIDMAAKAADAPSAIRPGMQSPAATPHMPNASGAVQLNPQPEPPAPRGHN